MTEPVASSNRSAIQDHTRAISYPMMNMRAKFSRHSRRAGPSPRALTMARIIATFIVKFGRLPTDVDIAALLACSIEKALLIVRHQLVDMHVRIDNQLRGILKTFGLVIGKCSRGQIGQRAEELCKGRPGIESHRVSIPRLDPWRRPRSA